MKLEMMAANLTRIASNLCPQPSSNLSSTSTFPPAEKENIRSGEKWLQMSAKGDTGKGVSKFPTAKDATPGAKRLKMSTNKPKLENNVRGLVEHAYFKALWTHGIKHPTVSDIKEILDFIRKTGPARFSVSDEEIENIMAETKAAYDRLEYF